MEDISQRIYECGIVPVVKLEEAELAARLARTLMAGGIRCIEVTFRTKAASQAIENIIRECPDMLVGAGTVLTKEQVDEAVNAGARFIVTPGFNRKIAAYCLEKEVSIFPGCNNPAVIEEALEMGITDLKFFPAEQSGGLPMIKALSAPYSRVRFMPTGGVNENNMNEYLANEKVLACGGTWMVKETLIKNRQFDEIEYLTRNAVKKMHGFELRHIGINCADEKEAVQRAGVVAELFGLEVKVGNSSVFAGQAFEMMKKEGCGEHGHICMAVNRLDRAYAHFKQKGIAFDEESKKLDEKGKMKVINFKEPIGGFVLQMINK